MSKPAASWAEMFMTVGAVCLAFRGDDPVEIAGRAQGAASAVRKFLGRIEEVSERQCRAVVGCQLLRGADCVPPCLYCEAKSQEGKPS
jgi:hypothetical protein